MKIIKKLGKSKEAAEVEKIKQIILNLHIRKGLYNDTGRVNQCLLCLLDVEKKIKSGEWKNISNPDKKLWYQINYDENQAVKNLIKEIRPREILEIGCGPGRIIDLILGTAREVKFHIERIIGLEQNREIYLHAYTRFLKSDPRTVHILDYFYGDSGSLYLFNESEFDITLAVSNLVGWQEDEVKWMKEAFRVSKQLFFTVYKKGFEEQRRRMYEALCGGARIDENRDIWIKNVEAFGKECRSKSYTRISIENKIEKVLESFPNSSYHSVEVGDFMFGYLLRKK